MPERPYVLLSCSMSLDGYLDSATDERLMLSNEADFDRVDEVRSRSDAILVGATTVRKDNPALLVRSEHLRHRRLAAGLPSSPLKVTLTAGGDLDPCGRFFTRGDRENPYPNVAVVFTEEALPASLAESPDTALMPQEETAATG